jgi:hypothetical protein
MRQHLKQWQQRPQILFNGREQNRVINAEIPVHDAIPNGSHRPSRYIRIGVLDWFR